MQVQVRTESVAPGTGQGVESQLDLISVVRILRRRKWLIAAILILGTGAAMLASRAITPRYTAKALVMLEQGQAKVVNIEAVVGGLVADPMTVDTQIELITSRRNIANVVQAMGLTADPEFRPPLPDDASDRALSWQRLLGWVPVSWLVAVGVAVEPPGPLENSGHDSSAQPPPSLPPAAASTEIDKILNRFERQLKVTQAGHSFVIAISFTSTDPARAAAAANKVAELYIEDRRDRKRASTIKATEWLRDRLASLKDELEQSEAAVQRYRAENRLAEASKTDVLDQQIADLNRELITTESDVEARQGRLAFIADLRRRGEPLDTLPEVLGSQVIIDLRRQEAELLRQEADLSTSLGERHPQMQLIRAEQARLEEKIAREVQRIVANLENEAQIVAARLERLRANFETLQDAGARSQEAGVRLGELERQAAAVRQLYESFLQRYQETREQEELVDSDAQLISAASPPEAPSTPGLAAFAGIGVGASSLLAVLAALLVDRLNTGLRSEAEVREALSLARIGLVPKLKRMTHEYRPHQYLIEKPYSSYTEAIRSAFAALKLADREHPAKLVLVTSALPQEGKSTLALSLAVLAAQSGERVLLVDFDLRHPSVLRQLNCKDGPGVCDYVGGEASVAEVIRSHSEIGIDLLGAGRPTHNPTALIQSPQFAQLLLTLRHTYDRVIIDSPPVLGITDAQLLAAMVDRVLLVIRWHTTAREFAQNAVALLRQANAAILGTVITQANLKKHMRYGYGDAGDYYGKHQGYYVN